MDGHQGQGHDGAQPGGAGRDRYIDFLRAFSLLVVVAWHWVFTIVRRQHDGPHATNPISFTTGLWTAFTLPVIGLFGRPWRRNQPCVEPVAV